jgi:hypothetical protein
LHVSQSRLETLKKLEPLEIRLAEAVLAERATQQDVAQRSHQRKLSLNKDKLVSAADVEDAAQELAAAQARYSQAETGWLAIARRKPVCNKCASSSAPIAPR